MVRHQIDQHGWVMDVVVPECDELFTLVDEKQWYKHYWYWLKISWFNSQFKMGERQFTTGVHLIAGDGVIVIFIGAECLSGFNYGISIEVAKGERLIRVGKFGEGNTMMGFGIEHEICSRYNELL